MKKICQYCGHENVEKDKFCRKCGKELIDAKVEPATQDVGEYKAPVAHPRHEKKKQPSVPGTSNKMALGIGIVAIIPWKGTTAKTSITGTKATTGASQ